MIHSRISGTGSYLPGEPVSNAALIAAHGLESSDEWIVERTGIRNRHLAGARRHQQRPGAGSQPARAGGGRTPGQRMST